MKILSTSFGIPIRNCTCGPSIVQSPLINPVHLGADGMITDDLEMIQDQVTIAQEDPEYTELLFKQAMEFFNFSNQKRGTVVPPMIEQVFS